MLNVIYSTAKLINFHLHAYCLLNGHCSSILLKFIFMIFTWNEVWIIFFRYFFFFWSTRHSCVQRTHFNWPATNLNCKDLLCNNFSCDDKRTLSNCERIYTLTALELKIQINNRAIKYGMCGLCCLLYNTLHQYNSFNSSRQVERVVLTNVVCSAIYWLAQAFSCSHGPVRLSKTHIFDSIAVTWSQLQYWASTTELHCCNGRNFIWN